MDKLTLLRNAKIREKEEFVDIIIKGQWIVSVTPTQEDIHEDIKQKFDLEGRLVLPSLINPHTHLDKAGLADKIKNKSGTIDEARSKLLEAKHNIEKKEIKERAKTIILNSIQNGVTIIRTHVDVDPVIGMKGIEALLELKQEFKDIIDLQIVAFPQEGISEAPGTYDLLHESMVIGNDIIVGGHLSIAKDYYEHTKMVFDLAEEFDRDIDVHVDYDIDRDFEKLSKHQDGEQYPDELGVIALAEETMKRKINKQICASHLCGLDSVKPEVAQKVMRLLAKAGVAVIALPPNNLYMHGRSDQWRVRRGVTRVKQLLDSGVEVIFGTDNIRDPFNPLGNSNMIHNAILTSYACHMNSEEDFNRIFDMCTVEAARILKLEHYGVAAGCYADLVVLDALEVEQALAHQATVTHVFKRGKLIATNKLEQKRLFNV